MTEPRDPVREMLVEAGALKRGHFLLSSGLHSDHYCQCATLFEDPARAGTLARMLADRLRAAGITPDTVLAPALGGILFGYELARALGARSLFAEREPGGPFDLRRGFALAEGERVLLAEDVVTTGKSLMEVVPLVAEARAHIVAFASIADRSQGRFRPAEPFFSLCRLDFEAWHPDRCPLCAAGIPAVKPGSRAKPAIQGG
jgi:orotate phosphoribosyltransferase